MNERKTIELVTNKKGVTEFIININEKNAIFFNAISIENIKETLSVTGVVIMRIKHLKKKI